VEHVWICFRASSTNKIGHPTSAWLRGLRKLAAAIIEALPKRQKRGAMSDLNDGRGRPYDIAANSRLSENTPRLRAPMRRAQG